MAPPASGPPEPVTLYVASDSDGTLRKTQMNRAAAGRSAASAPARCCARCSEPVFAGRRRRIPSARRRRARCVSAGRRHRGGGHQLCLCRRHPSGVLAEELTVASIVITLNANDQQDRARENPGQRTGARHPCRTRRLAALLCGQQHRPGREGHAMMLPRIGVFDSGVGGLTVLKAMAEQIARALPLLRRHGAPALRHQVGGDCRALRDRSDALSGSAEHRPAGDCLQHSNGAGIAAD